MAYWHLVTPQFTWCLNLSLSLVTSSCKTVSWRQPCYWLRRGFMVISNPDKSRYNRSWFSKKLNDLLPTFATARHSNACAMFSIICHTHPKQDRARKYLAVVLFEQARDINLVWQNCWILRKSLFQCISNLTSWLKSNNLSNSKTVFCTNFPFPNSKSKTEQNIQSLQKTF